MNTFDHIRASALQGAGYIEPIDVGPLDLLRKSEWSPEFERLLRLFVPIWSDEFEQLMRGCLLMGALRYGKLNAPGKPQWDRLSAIEHRYEEYRRTWNKMYLVDIANFCLLEFEEGEGTLPSLPSPFHINIRYLVSFYRKSKIKWELLLIAARCMVKFINDVGTLEPTENTKKVEVQ
jgi:hypothetical protein